ncbi:hypothetical protein FA15DRAFT_598092 [Coprinopsis marcescibilis]|uniref:Uncharacterized protein n=1 Tax=Coprinopsis marcescibilis TaxID=230819 RepID=A0A5C3KLV4_COPMA|nr:hypothetical protein FA15DRAFT_598092 [Coprinopsis marcescibilis]
MLWRKLVALLSVFVYQSDLTHAALVERRIDDTQGDSATGLRPVYLPAEGVWNGLDCSQCQLKPDIARVFGGTYSEATYRPARGIVSVDIQFEGVAIDVYFILAPFSARLTTLTECLFILDGGEPATFRYQPGAEDTEFIYEHSVFSRTDLPDANHTLRITVPEVPHELFLNFDYAIYMYAGLF